VGSETAPVTLGQTIYCSVVVILGALIMAFIFGNIAAVMSSMNKKESKFQEQMEMVSSTMRIIKLPVEI